MSVGGLFDWYFVNIASGFGLAALAYFVAGWLGYHLPPDALVVFSAVFMVLVSVARLGEFPDHLEPGDDAGEGAGREGTMYMVPVYNHGVASEDGGLVWVGGVLEGDAELEVRLVIVRKRDGDHAAAWSLRTGEQVSLSALSLAHLYLHKLAHVMLSLEEEIRPEFRIGDEEDEDRD